MNEHNENEVDLEEMSMEDEHDILDYKVGPESGENVLTQLDPYGIKLLESMIYDYTLRKDPKGNVIKVKGAWTKRLKFNVDGSVEQVATEFIEGRSRYPDVVGAYMWATTHINKNLNVRQHTAYYLIEDWYGLFAAPLELRYAGDPIIISFLDALSSILERNFNESIDGSGQNYNIKMQGGHRIQELISRKA